MKDMIIIGAGGHARTILDIAISNRFNVLGIIDLNFSGEKENILGVPVLGDMSAISAATVTNVFVAIGDNLKRAQVIKDLKSGRFELPTLIHPTAFVSNFAHLAGGCVVMSNVSINAGSKIGEGCIINTGATVDHECIVGSYVHIAPGVNIAGRVRIGEKSFLGIGSAVIDNISIGRDVLVGANSTVTSDIPDNSKYVGFKKFIS